MQADPSLASHQPYKAIIEKDMDFFHGLAGSTKLVYKPMLELFDYLRAHDFRIYVCSGGGQDFMRVFAEEVWGS